MHNKFSQLFMKNVLSEIKVDMRTLTFDVPPQEVILSC